MTTEPQEEISKPVEGDAPPLTDSVPQVAADTAKEEVEEQIEEDDPASLLALGTRALALKQYASACENLSRAVQRFTEIHGELADEIVAPVVLYGKALLANAIATSAVLGQAPQENVIQPDPQPSTSASASTSAPVTAQNINFHFGDSPPASPSPSASDPDEDDQEDPENDLETAFLMFDMARTILSRRSGEKEADIQRAEVHRLLGDVATESEQFTAAQAEYSTTLEILSPILPPTDRALSEIHMLLALALDFVPGQAAAAVEQAEAAREVLRLRGELPETSDTEKEDIKGLLVEIDNKIEDLKLALVLPEAPTTAAGEKAFDAFLRPDAPVNDLTSLVKKKKRPAAVLEDPDKTIEGEDKKAKLDV